MRARHCVIATAGHVDHGKGSLVKALTGTDPDRLPEEKSRGITLDLGFAHLMLPLDGNGSDVLHLGIVDVPGHEDLVKHMVAGVGAIQLALLVVAADQGWSRQTEEHLQILTYLQLPRLLVVLTRTDLVPEAEEPAQAEVRTRLLGSPYALARIIPTSSVTGRGLDELKAALIRALIDMPPPHDAGKPRLPIDRAFTLSGIGTVVTGTLLGGELRQGQSVLLQPTETPARIRSLHIHNRPAERAGPGTRVALNLSDVSVWKSNCPRSVGVMRGHVVGLPNCGSPSSVWDVALERSSRAFAPNSAFPRLRHDHEVHVHFQGSSLAARIVLAGQPELLPGEECFGQLRLALPHWVFRGDRFIVRDASERETLAGGVVLDPDAQRKFFHRTKQQLFLNAQKKAGSDTGAAIVAWIERDGILHRERLLPKSNFSSDELTQAVSRLSQAGTIVCRNDWIFGHSEWSNLARAFREAVDAHHRSHPEQPGLPVSELQAQIKLAAGTAAIAEAVVQDLIADGFTRFGSLIRRRSFCPALPRHLTPAAARIRSVLTARPLDPPSRAGLAPDAASQEALRFLVQNGEMIELSYELVMLADAFAKTRELVRQFLEHHPSATVSQLRQPTGASRRLLVPLLEKLDRDGLTRRVGDLRVLK